MPLALASLQDQFKMIALPAALAEELDNLELEKEDEEEEDDDEEDDENSGGNLRVGFLP